MSHTQSLFDSAPEGATDADLGRNSARWARGRRATDLKSLYYVTHVDNVASMLQRGILCHERVEAEGIQFEPIYNDQIVQRRRAMMAPGGRSLWDFANLYFQPRNPMLFRVLRDPENPKHVNEVAVLAVRPDIVNRSDVFISTGNAASAESQILTAEEGRKAIPQIVHDTDSTWWNRDDGSFRKIMAECLVPDVVPPEYIQAIYVATRQGAQTVERAAKQSNLPVITEPKMFFEPVRTHRIPPNLVVLAGDMFFSRMQTLTVSVNCVGVMGKGLASRAKYQFPDVYVRYQDLCRKRALRLGRPCLYKRESFFEQELADEPSFSSNANGPTWFLLFPTKRHWRQPADLTGIQKGLEWLQQNYKGEGVKSLAVPALGCGLGRLAWEDVGPVLCRSLSALDIPVEVYLPAEREVPDEYLSREFLLGTA